ncbi:MAG: hypothetical protein GXP62_07330 [Oligoflexia bacterium]|nr:hypothetical protein [Oligoflexia bacterium]
MQTALTHPKLAEIFRQLRDGRHLCLEDGELYSAVEENAEGFTDLFKTLGYALQPHRKGIYFFRGDTAVTDTARRFAVFTFILVEHLGDSGQGIEEALFTASFPIDEFPHLQSDRYRETMAEMGVSSVDDLSKLVRSMERFGFTAVDGERVRFRRPMYRLIDLCVRVLETEEDDA